MATKLEGGEGEELFLRLPLLIDHFGPIYEQETVLWTPNVKSVTVPLMVETFLKYDNNNILYGFHINKHYFAPCTSIYFKISIFGT